MLPDEGFGQRKVDAAFRGERVWAIVPMVGTGTARDPRRPLFAPVRGSEGVNGITGFTYHLSDDGRVALVEFVAKTPERLAAIVSSGRADVVVFERGKATLADVEREFRKYKASFDSGKIGGAR